MPMQLANLFYLAAAVCFILALKGLTHPRSAVQGNRLGSLGMLIAVVTALVAETGLDWTWILVGLVLGGTIGAILAYKIRMTAMPQLVALFNGFGGGASLFVAAAAMLNASPRVSETDAYTLQMVIASAVSAIVGSITLVGSLVAYAKLQGLIRKTLHFKGQHMLNIVLLICGLGFAILLVIQPTRLTWLWGIAAVAGMLGILLVSPIGGADMPVVIAVLNAYSGIAAGATGFVLNNNVLIISGSLVGTSGIILTQVMCRAMNRSFANVIMGVPMAGKTAVDGHDIYDGKVKSTSPDEVAMLLEAARRVVIVPGFGMAVSQAQYAVRDLAQLLESRSIAVEYGIHPVAGRMPGHMNVLLAEADIPYDRLKDMESINPTFDQVDVCLVIGANDVVNPDARNNSNSPIAGMPILNVDRARTVVVVKRSLSPGFAGIPNPLFAGESTLMLFDDGKAAINAVAASLKEGYA